MDNIKVSLFDIFSYALPGLLALIALFITMLPPDKEVISIVQLSQEIKIGSSILLIFISYIIGFGIDSPASYFLYYPVVRVFKNMKNISAPSTSEYRILARHYAPENYKFIQRWKLLKTMSHNLSFVFILMCFASFYHYTKNENDTYSIILSILSMLLSIALLHRAYLFDTWHFKELKKTVKILKLLDKTDKSSNKSNQIDPNSTRFLCYAIDFSTKNGLS